MTGAEHERKAEQCLEDAADCIWSVNGSPANDDRARAHRRAAQAQAHATLALTGAVRDMALIEERLRR
jgi:hypothetical protein